MTRLAIAILMLSTLTGCASMSGARTQTITVQTVQDHKEVTEAGCILANGVGRWFITTPGKITINKNIDDLTVECSKEDVGTGSETIASTANGGMWGNVLLGGPIGYVVDRKSGAGYDYPQTIVVSLKKAVPVTAPVKKAAIKAEDAASPPAADEPVDTWHAAPAEEPPVQQQPAPVAPPQAPTAEPTPPPATGQTARPQSTPASKPAVQQVAPMNDWQAPTAAPNATATPYIPNY